MTDALLERASQAVNRRSSRRGFLGRVAVVAAALSVGPIRYAARPGTALGVVTCRGCSRGSSCCDGWTTFCCTITGKNVCPENAYAGGWWKCTSYAGTRYCEGTGVRYYVDCNLLPDARCEGGCRCGNDRCQNRRTCCVNFRYGNCRTDVREITPVVCRVMLCSNPCRYDAYENCSCQGPVDNRTCEHEAGCLPPPPAVRRRRRERREGGGGRDEPEPRRPEPEEPEPRVLRLVPPELPPDLDPRRPAP